jgi:hypothetical protein
MNWTSSTKVRLLTGIWVTSLLRRQMAQRLLGLVMGQQ